MPFLHIKTGETKKLDFWRAAMGVAGAGVCYNNGISGFAWP